MKNHAPLPDVLFTRRLGECECAYANGNLGALQEVFHLCDRQKEPLPKWARVARDELMQEAMEGQAHISGQGRHARWKQQYLDDMADYARWDAVRECVEHDVPWAKAYEAAERILRGGLGAAGSSEIVKKSYQRVQKRMRSYPGRYTIFESMPLPRPIENPQSPEFWAGIHKMRKKKRG